MRLSATHVLSVLGRGLSRNRSLVHESNITNMKGMIKRVFISPPIAVAIGIENIDRFDKIRAEFSPVLSFLPDKKKRIIMVPDDVDPKIIRILRTGSDANQFDFRKICFENLKEFFDQFFLSEIYHAASDDPILCCLQLLLGGNLLICEFSDIRLSLCMLHGHTDQPAVFVEFDQNIFVQIPCINNLFPKLSDSFQKNWLEVR